MKIKSGDLYMVDYAKKGLELTRVDTVFDDKIEVTFYSIVKKKLVDGCLFRRSYIKSDRSHKIDNIIVKTKGGELLYELMFPGFKEQLRVFKENGVL